MNQANQQFGIFAKIVEECERKLKAIGADYAIVVGGEKRGNLDVVMPRAASNRVQRNRKGSFFKIYAVPVESMQPTDVLSLNPADYGISDKDSAESFRASVVSYARRTFGQGNTQSHTNAQSGAIEVLRIA